jgi:hypothetical protein
MEQKKIKKTKSIYAQRNGEILLNKEGKPILLESPMHKACVAWFIDRYESKGLAYINHQANENPKGISGHYNRVMSEMGRKAGFPDLQIFCNKKILLIELKAENGKFSDGQIIQFKLLKMQGFEVKIIKTKKDFILTVDEFVKSARNLH